MLSLSLSSDEERKSVLPLEEECLPLTRRCSSSSSSALPLVRFPSSSRGRAFTLYAFPLAEEDVFPLRFPSTEENIFPLRFPSSRGRRFPSTFSLYRGRTSPSSFSSGGSPFSLYTSLEEVRFSSRGSLLSLCRRSTLLLQITMVHALQRKITFPLEAVHFSSAGSTLFL